MAAKVTSGPSHTSMTSGLDVINAGNNSLGSGRTQHQRMSSLSSTALATTTTTAGHQQPPPPVTNARTNAGNSVSSLFERVTNFRRSLIKTQNKKKIRPTPGSGPNHLSKNNGPESNSPVKVSKVEQQQCAKSQEQSVRDLISSLTAGMQEVPSGQSTTTTTTTAKNIVVDEEDAIYGFTSSHLNHPGPLRRTLKVAPAETNNNMCSPTKTSSSPPHIYAVAKNVAASASCVSLYETIDEVDDALPPPPGLDSPIRKAAAAAGLVGQQNPNKSAYDWRTNRRSSAIILSSDFYEYDHHKQQQQQHREAAARMINQSMGNILATEQLRPQQPLQAKYFVKNSHNGGGAASGGHRYQGSGGGGRHASNGGANVTGLAMRRSSDDLLMMAAAAKERCNGAKGTTAATSASAIVPTNRIYENLRTQMFAMIGSSNGALHSAGGRHASTASSSTATASSSSSSGHYQNHHHQQQQHPHRYRDSRKLTKDSGYESTSTLVSLTQLNSIGLASTTLASTTSTTTAAQVVHSRSDSIDSMGSNNSSTEAGRSLSPRIDSHKPKERIFDPLESPLPPPPCDLSPEVLESPPPTPPVRCSSLIEQQQQQQQSAGTLWQLSFDAMQRQHIDLLCGRQLSHLSNGVSNEQANTTTASSLSSNSSSGGSQYQQQSNGQGNKHDLQQLPPPPLPTKATTTTGYHTYNRSNPEENGLPLVEQHYFEPSVIINAPAARSSMVAVSNGHSQPNQRGVSQSNRHSIGMLFDYPNNNSNQQQFVYDIDIDEVLANVAPGIESSDSNLTSNLPPPLSSPPPLPPKVRAPAIIGGKSNDYINLQQTPRTSKQHSTTINNINNNNNNTVNGSDIKAIQKRALYEFYLRQKEKKEKERRQAAEMDNNGSSSNNNNKKVRLAEETRSHEIDTPHTNLTGTTTKVNANVIQQQQQQEDECTLNGNNNNNKDGDDGIALRRGQEEEEEEMPLPSPPTPLKMSMASATAADGQHMPPPPPPAAQFVFPSVVQQKEKDDDDDDEDCCPPLPAMPPPPLCEEDDDDDDDQEVAKEESVVDPRDLPPPPTPLCQTTPSPSVAANGKVLLTTDLDEILNEAPATTLATSITPPLPSPPVFEVIEEPEGKVQPKESTCEFYSIDLEHLWPSIDFAPFWPLDVYRCNSSNNNNAQIGKDNEKEENDDEEEVEDEELASIEQCHKQKLACSEAITRLQAKLVELQTATHTNEQLGDWIRDRLAVVLDNNNIDAAEETGAVGGGGNGNQDRSKFDLFCKDIVLVIRLIVSIMNQMATNERTMIGADRLAESDERLHKRDRLRTQLNEAVKLRDNITTRRLILETRLKKRLVATTTRDKATAAAAAANEVDLNGLLHHYLASKEALIVQLEMVNLLLGDVHWRLDRL